MKQKIPSEYVARKLNDWYNAIRKNQIAASESLKADGAAACYEKGIRSAASLGDEEHAAKLNILCGLYLDGGDQKAVENGFDYLESNHLYAAVEELALDAAQYYNQIERLKDSIFYYEKCAQASRKIKRGDALYES
ncbi:hypothetical protein ABEV83_14800 [Bacillus licheniformis]